MIGRYQIIKVIAIDDNVICRKFITDAIENLQELEFIGTAPNYDIGLRKIQLTSPDLVILSLDMTDSITILQDISWQFPNTKVLVVGNKNSENSGKYIKAMDAGALEFISRERNCDPTNLIKFCRKLKQLLNHFPSQHKIDNSFRKKTGPPLRKTAATPAPSPKSFHIDRKRPYPIPSPKPKPTLITKQIPIKIDLILFAVSTGGPNALKKVIPKLPGNLGVPVLIVQHMPPTFTEALAINLDEHSQLQVKEAENDEIITPETVLIAPGGKHLQIKKGFSPTGMPVLKTVITMGPPVNSCRPSADVLFKSVAKTFIGGVLAIVMTGMGKDGAEGVQSLKLHNCYCLTQSAASCTVYGMPKAVVSKNLSDEQVPLNELANRISLLAARK
jgi:two-component system, chemotaxis family, protein-glutamate methylesterase/glutaminase